MQAIALKLLVVAMMASVGLQLRPADLRRGLAQRRALGTALVVNLVVVPGGAALVTGWLGLSPGIVGALLLGLLPALLRPRGDGVLRSAAMVTVVRNLSVALLLSSRFFADPSTDIAVLVCGFWMMLLPAVLGWLAGRAVGSSASPLTPAR